MLRLLHLNFQPSLGWGTLHSFCRGEVTVLELLKYSQRRGKGEINSVARWLRQPEENLAICSSFCSRNGSHFFVQKLFYLVPYSRAACRNILPRPQGI